MKFAYLAATALAAALLAIPASAGDRGGRGGGRLEAMDTNGDGKVTRAEAEASANARFDSLDANKDGRLAGDELPGKGRWGKHRGGDGGEKADKADVSIIKADFVERALKRFDRLDADSDGVVTQEEIDAAKEKFKSRHRGH